jgi:hypothetical protein
MCENCDVRAREAATTVTAIVNAERHARVLYRSETSKQHCTRLAMTILETQAPPQDFGPMQALSVETLNCLALQYATAVQRLIALHELGGIPIPE